MLYINPFAELSHSIPSIFLQVFVLAMLALIGIGTVIQMIHHKNLTYFFNNAKKAKLSATKELGARETVSIIAKTVVNDIATTAELGAGKRRVAHVLGMWGTIIFWIASVVMIFCYTSGETETPYLWPMMWHIGAIMTCIGGYWFWLFLRVDVYSEAYPWYRIIKADLFVLALLACATFGLAWSYTQSLNLENRWDDKVFLTLYIVSNLILFGGVYWSKFAHMFYKPGAAIQKNLAEADGSRDNLPPPADAPEQYGLGIKREVPKHY
jgi:hypothetical protein